jgi:hypothetical protein
MVGPHVVGNPASFDLLDLLQPLNVETPFVVNIAARVRARHHRAAELLHFLDCVDGDVSGSRDDAGLALEALAGRLEHFLDEEDEPVAGGLRTHQCAAPVEPLSRQHRRLVAIGDPLVLSKEVADLARADADVAGRYVGVFTEVSIELSHEALAEPHDLGVGAAFRVEIGPSFTAADRHARECVLEDLLEAEKLHHAQVHRRVKAQSALVGTQRAVELDSEPAVDVDTSGIVLPGDPEDDLTFGLADPLDDAMLAQFRVLVQDRTERPEDFEDRLMEFRFSRISPDHFLEEQLQLFVNVEQHSVPVP